MRTAHEAVGVALRVTPGKGEFIAMRWADGTTGVTARPLGAGSGGAAEARGNLKAGDGTV